MVKVKECPLLKWKKDRKYPIWKSQKIFISAHYEVEQNGPSWLAYYRYGGYHISLHDEYTGAESKKAAIQLCESHACSELKKMAKYFEEANKDA